MSERRPRSAVAVFVELVLGVGLLLGLHVFCAAAVGLTGMALSGLVDGADEAFVTWLLYLGLVQWTYVIPTGAFFWWYGRLPVTLGLAIGAGLTFAATSLCASMLEAGIH